MIPAAPCECEEHQDAPAAWGDQPCFLAPFSAGLDFCQLSFIDIVRRRHILDREP